MLNPPNPVEESDQDKLAEGVFALTPEPLSVTVAGELVALLMIEMLPTRLPVLRGANTTLTLVLCPALKLIGSAAPDTL